ncbi:AraC family transcriptional regulator [Paenibacillus ferrarius]|uniref:AraC family transcriptional regulator n=1 Tax=Paenibacillus ferrarius TaxID=1469647 RepID=UPI003D28B29E
MPDTRGLFPARLTAEHVQPQVVAYYFKQWQGFQMPFHTHEFAEIMYVIDGTCDVELQLSSRQIDSVKLKKGEFIVLDATVPHRLLVGEAGPCRMLNVEFRYVPHSGALPSILQLAKEEEVVATFLKETESYLVLRDPDEVYYVMKSLVLELDKVAGRSEMLVQLLFVQLLVRIARLRAETLQGASEPSDFYVKQSMAFMQQNYDRDMQVKDIAQAVSLHPGYLQRIFKKVTGQTLMAYLTALRMEKACMLLLETDVPIAEICDYVGIGSRQYFHMLFKAHTNQTPAEYRNARHTHKLLVPR